MSQTIEIPTRNHATTVRPHQKGVLLPALTETFDPIEKFNGTPRYILTESFRKNLVEGTKPFSNVPETILETFVVRPEDGNDKTTAIMELIGVSRTSGLLSKEEILYRISHFTRQQPNGENGPLNSPWFVTVIGYFMDTAGKIRVAFVRWDTTEKVWRCSEHLSDLWPFGGNVSILVGKGILRA